MRPWVGRTGVPRSSAGSEGVKKYRKWVAMVRKIRTLQHVANPISEFLHTLSAGAILSRGRLAGGRRGPLRLSPLEPGLALFVEGAHALEAILGRHRVVVGLDGQRHAGLEVGLAAPVDGLLRLAHRHRAVRGDGGCDLERLRA